MYNNCTKFSSNYVIYTGKLQTDIYFVIFLFLIFKTYRACRTLNRMRISSEQRKFFLYYSSKNSNKKNKMSSTYNFIERQFHPKKVTKSDKYKEFDFRAEFDSKKEIEEYIARLFHIVEDYNFSRKNTRYIGLESEGLKENPNSESVKISTYIKCEDGDREDFSFHYIVLEE